MSPGSRDSAAGLRQLARLYGILTSYVGMEGRRVDAAPESLLAALRGLGAPVEGPLDFADALIMRRRHEWEWRLDPAIVAWEGKSPRIELRLPAAACSGPFEARLRLEDGGEREWRSRLEDLKVAARREIAGETFVALTLPLPGDDLPLGYHKLALTAGARQLDAWLIAAPRRAYQAPATKQWGVFLPLYALHSRQSYGIGDYSDLRRLVEWAAQEGAGFVGTLPLLASFLESPFDPSPYAPVSRLFWNEVFIDVSGARPQPASLNLKDEPLVAYGETMARKRRILAAQAASFFAGTVAQQAEYVAFAAARPEVEDYARFRAAVERLGPDWRHWPERQRAGELTGADFDQVTASYFAYAQWRTEQQMQAVSQSAGREGAGLYLDLPVGVHALGYDAWRYQDQFAAGLSVGAPPDVVTTSGQNWGFAPLSPEALRRTGFAYLRAYLSHHMRSAGLLRVDHAMGLHRLFCIPEGASAAEGVYVRYPADELYAVHCLESQHHRTAIIAENLGILTAGMNQGMASHGLARMYVMCIELRADEQQPFRAPPRDVVASFGTHDLPPFAAYWTGSDIDERVRLGVLSAERAQVERREREANNAALLGYLEREGLLADESLEAIFRGILAVLAASSAGRVLFNLEDLWLESESQNVPGTLHHQHPSWRRRARYGLEELPQQAAVREALALLRRLRPKG